MKRLTLIRHAKSSHKDGRLQDFDRPLNRRGVTDAPLMAERLTTALSKPDLLLYSPAQRSLSTAESVIPALNPSRAKAWPELYMAELQTLLALLASQPKSRRHLLLIGHNPGLQELANYLLPEPIAKLPTSAVLSLELEDWQPEPGSARIFYHYWPKQA